MKVFISHQKADSAISAKIAQLLKYNYSIDSYLDVIDLDVIRGEDLAEHLRSEMSKCTQLLAVISEATRTSWWVPWEIGVATEKEFPLATFSSGPSLPPEYLRKWPYLRTENDVGKYAEASMRASRSFVAKRSVLNEEVARVRSTREFFADLRTSLNQ